MTRDNCITPMTWPCCTFAFIWPSIYIYVWKCTHSPCNLASTRLISPPERSWFHRWLLLGLLISLSKVRVNRDCFSQDHKSVVCSPGNATWLARVPPATQYMSDDTSSLNTLFTLYWATRMGLSSSLSGLFSKCMRIEITSSRLNQNRIAGNSKRNKINQNLVNLIYLV